MSVIVLLRKDTFRHLCALAVKYKASIYQADIKNAYPLSSLDEEIYCAEPEGVEFLDLADQVLVKLDDNEVLQLLRSLYGLKQAG